MNNKRYDVILVLGRGINKNGFLPDGAKKLVRKAVELYREGLYSYIIFSGKSSYKSKTIYPKTEAEAMAEYAISLGIGRDSILTENKSTATVFNLCYVKKEILEPRNFKKIIIVTIFPHNERVSYNSEMVLGPGYQFDIALADSPYDLNDEAKAKEIEKNKMQEAKKMFAEIMPGDDKVICKKANEELAKRKL